MSAIILLEKNFIKTITEITFANIDNEMLCLDTSSIIHIVLDSSKATYELTTIFSGIKRFELILALLTAHHSNDEICVNMLYVLNKIFVNTGYINIPEEEIEKFFKSGIVETFYSIVDKIKSDSVYDQCNVILKTIQGQGKTTYHFIYSYFQLIYFII